MRRIHPAGVLVLAVACSHTGAQPEATAPAQPLAPAGASAPLAAADERAADEAAYRFLYLPSQRRLTADDKGEWVAIVAGRVVPASGAEPAPVKTMEAADAAARAAVPNAKHRFIFMIGEEGDVDWPMGGCELAHVLGTKFMALLERDDLVMNLSPSHPSVTWRHGDTVAELAVKGADARMYVRPLVGAPGADGSAGPAFCVSTGFGGVATMSPESAKGLELWEIPGTAHITQGVFQSGDCRRARARFHWANTPLDFTQIVAIWPK